AGERWTLWLIVAACSLPLAIITYGSVYSRYMIDDYCARVLVSKTGWLNFVVNFYTGWMGTFSAWSLHAIIPSAQTLALAIIPSVLAGFGLLYATVKALLGQLAPAVKHSALLSLAGASLFFAVFLTSLPSLHQSLFWYAAAAHYMVPSLLAPLVLLLILKAKSAWISVALFVLCFMLAGFNFGFTLAQLVALSAFVVATLRHARLRTLLFVSLLGAMLGTAVMILAPGNAVRDEYTRTLFKVRADAVGAAIDSLLSAIGMFAQIAHDKPLKVAVALGLPALFAYYYGAAFSRKGLWLIAVITLASLCVAASFFPIFYVNTEFFSGRTLTTSVWVVFLSLIALGYVIGVLMRGDKPLLGYMPRRSQIVAVVLALGFALDSTPFALRAVQRQAALAAAWDERDAYLRSLSGSTEIVRVRSFNGAFDLPDLVDDPNYTTNACIAAYYNLKTILPDDQPPFVP
ncbi:MAG: DUF6056 family protein, partial [Anaerolineae bacterium]|nr:DUF6056 family protein [Anaerolineae bacterium]